VLCRAALIFPLRYIFGLIGCIERPCMGLFGDPELKVGGQDRLLSQVVPGLTYL
jgi:hypothetical protein